MLLVQCTLCCIPCVVSYFHETSSIWLQFSDIPNLANLNEEDYDMTLTCVFWDSALAEGSGNWSSEGCQLLSDVADKAICGCNHLTSFALLMVCVYVWGLCMCNHSQFFAQDLNPRSTPTEPTPVTFALEIITYVGLAISIIGLLLTIITYLVVRYV